MRGKGISFWFMGHGRSRGGNPGNRSTCFLCGKYGHVVLESRHVYDEYFVPLKST